MVTANLQIPNCLRNRPLSVTEADLIHFVNTQAQVYRQVVEELSRPPMCTENLIEADRKLGAFAARHSAIRSALGHSLPIYSAPVPMNVRSYSNSDRILRRSEMTLSANSCNCRNDCLRHELSFRDEFWRRK
jgi:hypothetical protein